MAFAGVPTQRLRRWYQAGIYGKSRVGRGAIRLYSFTDAVMTLMVREFMDLTRSRAATGAFGAFFEKLIPDYLANLTDQSVEAFWIFARWDRKEGRYRCTGVAGGGAISADIDTAALVLRLDRIVGAAAAYFRHEGVVLPVDVLKHFGRTT